MLHEMNLKTVEENFNGVLAKIYYNDEDNTWKIRIEKEAPINYLPLILHILAEKGVYDVTGEWALRFVRDRIVPPDRQNIGQILRQVGIPYYDEYPLLIYSSGRCCQDDCYLEIIK